jgi:hypothetical protein
VRPRSAPNVSPSRNHPTAVGEGRSGHCGSRYRGLGQGVSATALCEEVLMVREAAAASRPRWRAPPRPGKGGIVHRDRPGVAAVVCWGRRDGARTGGADHRSGGNPTQSADLVTLLLVRDRVRPVWTGRGGARDPSPQTIFPIIQERRPSLRATVPTHGSVWRRNHRTSRGSSRSNLGEVVRRRRTWTTSVSTRRVTEVCLPQPTGAHPAIGRASRLRTCRRAHVLPFLYSTTPPAAWGCAARRCAGVPGRQMPNRPGGVERPPCPHRGRGPAWMGRPPLPMGIEYDLSPRPTPSRAGLLARVREEHAWRSRRASVTVVGTPSTSWSTAGRLRVEWPGEPRANSTTSRPRPAGRSELARQARLSQAPGCGRCHQQRHPLLQGSPCDCQGAKTQHARSAASLPATRMVAALSCVFLRTMKPITEHRPDLVGVLVLICHLWSCSPAALDGLAGHPASARLDQRGDVWPRPRSAFDPRRGRSGRA